MAGLRAGAALGRPDLLEKIRSYGAGALPVTGMVGAIASLKVKDLVPTAAEDHRRHPRGDGRVARQEGLRRPAVGSEHDHGRRSPAGPGVRQAMLKEKVAIGRTWPSMPNHVRVTIGTREEMAKFRAAFARVMNA